jgi:phytoene desaturase
MTGTTAKRRAAIVGSGFGGLATAIRLQAAGWDTVLFEARDKPGGRAYSFEEQGFTFDAGPTVITAPSCLEELFEVADRKMVDYVEMIPVKPFYRLLWFDGDQYEYDGETESMLAQIRERNPSDAEGYLRFYEFSKANFETGYQELASAAFLRLWDMVKVAPAMMRLRSDRSVYDTVARFVTDEHLRQALSFHTLLIGGNPYETSSIYCMIHYLERLWGVFFPRGGTGALVRALAKLHEDIGGELRLSTPVRRIDAESEPRKGVFITTDERKRERFDVVVSNADLYHTYADLLRHDPRAEPMRLRLEKMRWSMSLFVIYFGTDRVYPDIAHHSIIFGDRYEGLLHDIFHGTCLPEDFSLYLHAPTVTDPSLAPKGCAGFYVLSPVPHLGQAPIDWDTVGPRYADRILEALEQFLPDLRKHIVVRKLFTAADFEGKLNAYLGNGFSVAPLLTQSAWMRPHNQDPRIPELYIVGAGTHPGAGVPGVINSAKATSRLILASTP